MTKTQAISFPSAESSAPFGSLSIAKILLLAGLLRIASIFVVRNYLHPYAWEFGEIAHVIFAGDGFTTLQQSGVRVPSAHMPPFYPYLLAIMWKLVGQSAAVYLGLEIVQALFGVLLVLLTYRLACILSSVRVALVAAAVVAVWPPLVYICNEFHSINFYIVFGVAAVYYLVRFLELSQSWADAVKLGLSMGALAYCRAEAPLLLACYALVMMRHRGRAVALKAIVAFVVGGLCLSPWVIRNYSVFGRIVLVTTSAGFNLWVGHNPRASGNSEASLSYLLPEQRAKLYQEPPGLPSAEILNDALFKGFATTFIREHPRQELRLAATKLAFFVLFDPTHAKASHVGYWLPSLLLTLLGCCGIWIRRGQLLGRDLPLMLTICYSIVLALVLFSVPRYRIAVDPFVAIFAAHAIVSLARQLRIGQGSALPSRALAYIKRYRHPQMKED